MSKERCFYYKNLGHMKFECPILEEKLDSDGKGKDVKTDDEKYENVTVVED